MSLEDLENGFKASLQRSLEPAAVASQVVLMVAISAVTVLVFNILRPKNKIVYEPKVKYHVGNKDPPRISSGLFGWVSPLLHTKEPELVDKIGLDAATFLRFLRMMRWLFTAVGALACAVLIPLDLVYTGKHPAKHQTILSRMSIRDVTGTPLYVHVAASYAFTGLVLGFTWLHWSAMVRLRRAWFRSPEYAESFYARTLLITQVPKKLQSDEGLQTIFSSVKMPYPTTAVHIGRRVGHLPELIEYHNGLVRKLEEYLVRYLKDGKIGKKRPTIRIGGFLGIMGGEKVDAIDYYTKKLAQSEAKVDEQRDAIDKRKAQNYGFASLAAVEYAHIVAAQLHKKSPRGATIQMAPNPKDIIWGNLTISPAESFRKKMWGFVILAVVCFLNTIPLLIITFLANLSSLTSLVPFLASWQSAAPFTFDIISGVLPPAVSGLFGWALPRIMRSISKYQGGNTQSRLDRAVVQRYFFFLVISQLIIFTLCGLGYQIISSIVDAVGKKESFGDIIKDIKKIDVLSSIDQAYVAQSNYWLTFFPLRGFLVFFDLAQIINLVWVTIKKRLFGRTPRDIRDWTQPPDFEYAIYYSNMLFMACVGLVFAPLVPLVTISAAVVFWVSSWVYKYQLMFVFVSSVETGGRLWNVVINRLLFSTILMQALLILTLGIQFGWRNLQWISSIPPIFIVLIFKACIARRFGDPFRHYKPTQAEISSAKVHSQRADDKGNRLQRRFGHPALHAELFTPMLHANMMPLLPQVFSGKIGSATQKMTEFAGQKVDTTVVQGGIRIAGIAQSDLDYDVTQYQRDQGDPDWDARSMASANVLGDTASLAPSKSVFYANGRSASPAPTLPKVNYDRYLAHGPGSPGPQEFELARFDTNNDQAPLLYSDANMMQRSVSSLPQYPGPSASSSNLVGDWREAPLHRPYPPSRDPSGYGSDASGGGEANMAGRGAHRR